MFISLKNRKGQGITAEYTITFFLVVAIISSMTVYLRRSMQARIRNSYNYMMKSVLDGYPSSARLRQYTNGIPVWYEPYYARVSSNRVVDSVETRRGFASPGFTSGVAEKEYDTSTTLRMLSNQAPPTMAD